MPPTILVMAPEPARPRPHLEFDALYGWAYDTALNVRPLAAIAMAGWGADAGRLLRTMAEAVACEPGQSVLDCPAGGGTALAAGASGLTGRAVAVDLIRPMLERARRRLGRAGLSHRVSLVRADARRLPLADASVDRVACFMGLHCIPDQGAVLYELARVLRPGGRLAGATLCADPPPPWRLAVRLARRVYRDLFTPPAQAELARWGREAGFDWRQDRTGAMLYVTAVRNWRK